MDETAQSKLPPAQDENGGFVYDLYDWAEAVAFSLAFVVLLFTFVFRIVGVIGPSMLNTLQEGNRLIICNINYTPKDGDIVVLQSHDKSLPNNAVIIKRVIATGGQTVDIDYSAHKVIVDDKALNEPYIREPMQPIDKWGYQLTKLPVTVPKGCVFVMGDNRNNSLDSRTVDIGIIDTRYILGRAVWRLLPAGEFGAVK